MGRPRVVGTPEVQRACEEKRQEQRRECEKRRRAAEKNDAEDRAWARSQATEQTGWRVSLSGKRGEDARMLPKWETLAERTRHSR